MSKLKETLSNEVAEKYILGYIINNEEILEDLILQVDDFYYQDHKEIYQILLDLKQEWKWVDIVTVWSKYENIWYLYDITDWASISYLVKEYQEILLEKTELRKLHQVWTEMIQSVWLSEDSQDIKFMLDHFIRDNETRTKQEVYTIWEVAADIDIEEKQWLFCWLDCLDKILTWFKPWDFVVLAARASMGKTASAMTLAYNQACKDIPTLFISIEMSNEQMAKRVISLSSELSLFAMNYWDYKEEFYQQIDETKWLLNHIPLRLVDNVKSYNDVERIIKQQVKKNWIKLVYIDYIQLLKWWWRYAWNRAMEISEISWQIKQLALELWISIIWLAQLNRWIEWRVEKEPMLADLKSSGSLEEDADIVIMLQRPEYYNPDEEPWKGRFYIKKNRNWPTGSCRVDWNKHYMKFTDEISLADTIMQDDLMDETDDDMF